VEQGIMGMIRKQLYIAPEHQRKLRALAARWHCTEAAVVRRAIERLDDDLAREIDRRLAEAGLLAPPPDDEDILTEEEEERLQEEIDAWVASLPEPLRLSDAVLEDRR
jgi:alkylation response protein AidB-like acyl-CoA dehydrogenase